MLTKDSPWFKVSLFSLVLLFVLACTMLEPVPTPTSPPQAPVVVISSPDSSSFVGSWTSIDSDGSNQELVISATASGTYDVSYTDSGASACGKDSSNKPIYGATATGNLTASGYFLSGSLPIFCQKNPPSLLADHFFQFTFDPNSGILRDDFGITWTRK